MKLKRWSDMSPETISNEERAEYYYTHAETLQKKWDPLVLLSGRGGGKG